MPQHTRVDLGQDDIDPLTPLTSGPTLLEGAAASPQAGDPQAGLPQAAPTKVQCDACPVLCHISPGRTGACDRWGNVRGVLTRVDPVLIARQSGNGGEMFVTGVGAGTTYPDYKPAPFIVASEHAGVDMVTAVT